MSIYCCWTSLQQTSFLFRCQCLTLVIKSTSYLICIQSDVSIPHRPAKRDKWRKCHLQKLLVCAEVSQHEHDKKKGIYAYFRGFLDTVQNSWPCGNYNYNKHKKAFIRDPQIFFLLQLFDCAQVFPQNLQHVGMFKLNSKTNALLLWLVTI